MYTRLNPNWVYAYWCSASNSNAFVYEIFLAGVGVIYPRFCTNITVALNVRC